MNVVDLCSGAAGGWSLGLHRAGMTTVAACEAVAWRRDLYAANFPKVKLYDDLRTLTGEQLRLDGVRRVDVLAGSPPCKEYGPTGRGGGLDADDLFLHAVRLVDELRPGWFAAENSHFIKTRGYDRIVAALAEIGYSCWALVVRAHDLGARHGRPRAVILATDMSRTQRRAPRLTWPDGNVGQVPDGPSGRFARYDRERLGPAGAKSLGRHLFEYDGLPSGVAEQCREALGDAVLPQLTEAVGRAIIAAELALCQ